MEMHRRGKGQIKLKSRVISLSPSLPFLSPSPSPCSSDTSLFLFSSPPLPLSPSFSLTCSPSQMATPLSIASISWMKALYLNPVNQET